MSCTDCSPFKCYSPSRMSTCRDETSTINALLGQHEGGQSSRKGALPEGWVIPDRVFNLGLELELELKTRAMTLQVRGC